MNRISLTDAMPEHIRDGDRIDPPKRCMAPSAGAKMTRTAAHPGRAPHEEPMMIDETHDPHTETWVVSAQQHPEFPIQNLPLGRFTLADGAPRTGMAIGEQVLDLNQVAAMQWLQGEAMDALQQALHGPIGLNRGQRLALRRGVFDLLRVGGPGADRARAHGAHLLHNLQDCTLLLPSRIGSFTDFNAGIHHTRNGRQMRGDGGGSLPRNYHHVPIAYHARTSSVCLSGTPVRRPLGQTLPKGAEQPVYGPVQWLDIELELGIWIARGNALGETIPIEEAADHIAGYCLLNDWSARDIMAWEMDRLGPFLGKNFATTISPWVISPEALAPFRRAAYVREPAHEPLQHLLDPEDQRHGALDLQLAVDMRSRQQRQAGESGHRVVTSSTAHLYWTPAQMVCHHASNGCNLEPGDLLGTGTISGPEPEMFASFRERSRIGTEPFRMGQELRCWAEDGDDIALSAWGVRDGYAPIGFGPCRAEVLPALTAPSR